MGQIKLRKLDPPKNRRIVTCKSCFCCNYIVRYKADELKCARDQSILIEPTSIICDGYQKRNLESKRWKMNNASRFRG